MKENHLTDEILQAYLLKDVENMEITKHLSECFVCQKKLEEYQFFITAVNEVKSETFGFDVEKLVMNKITLYEKKKNKKQTFFFWGILIFLFVVISSLSIPFIPKVFMLFKSKSICTTLFVIVTSLVISLFLLTDTIKQYKMKENKIFKNNLQPIL